MLRRLTIYFIIHIKNKRERLRKRLRLRNSAPKPERMLRSLFADGNTKPLPTFGTFTAYIICTVPNVTVEAAWLCGYRGRLRTLLCQKTFDPQKFELATHWNRAFCEQSQDRDHRTKTTKHNGQIKECSTVWILKGYEFKLNVYTGV